MRVRIDGTDYLVDIEYLPTGAGQPIRVPLSKSLFSVLQPTLLAPVRPMQNSHHKTNKPGLQYVECTQQLVAYESRLEGLALLLLDWEGSIASVQGQPFTIHFRRDKRPTKHTPDFLVADPDGGVSVVNVKPAAKVSDPRVRAQFDATDQVCEQVGWTHRIITTPSRHLASNLRLIAGYRRPPADADRVMPIIRTTLAHGPLPFGDLVDHVADRAALPTLLVTPIVLHGLWSRSFTAALESPLSRRSAVALPTGVNR